MKQLFKKKNYSDNQNSNHLVRVLTTRDIVFFGIAAIIGAGSFSSLGEAIYKGGPGVILLYIICGVSCCFTALCYAEFASRIPTAGSAYTYAYATFGELAAWIIGWMLIMEYSFGNIYVAFSWSDYFTSLLDNLGLHIPEYFSCSYTEAEKAVKNGSQNLELISAWENAPRLGSLRVIFDLPALLINALITWICYIGVKESKNFNNLFVLIKLLAIVLVIAIGVFYINADNWMPIDTATGEKSFLSNGFTGIMSAISGVFFAYIGFDALSVLSEETKDPQRDLPKGMIISIFLCTAIYIALTLTLTGLVDYRKFEGIGDPLSFVFKAENINLPLMEFIIEVVAIVSITTVLLVFQMGQPRIWYAMSRDGLIPKKFQQIHKKNRTPSFATIVTGFVVGVPILFTDKSFILDFTSIGTIFAFVLVCGGVLLLPPKEKVKGHFHLPYINGQWIFPLLFIGGLSFIYFLYPSFFENLMDFSDEKEGEFRFAIFIYFAKYRAFRFSLCQKIILDSSAWAEFLPLSHDRNEHGKLVLVWDLVCCGSLYLLCLWLPTQQPS